jgi:hypothetical protein
VSQINPFRGVVIPSGRPQGVQVHKDRQQRRRSQNPGQEPAQEEAQQQSPQTPDDGKPHVDLKA